MDKGKFLLLGISGSLAACTAAAERPNVIYVFPDQFRNCSMNFWNDPEYAGAQKWKADPSVTPRLREFASQSVVLSNCMSNCPLSSPYRGIFLSGMYPERSGIMSNCMSRRPGCSLTEDPVCISDVYKAAGYNCAYIGKLHAHAPRRNDPQHPGKFVDPRRPAWDAYSEPSQRHGFDYWYAYGTWDVHKNPHYFYGDGQRSDPHEFSVKHEADKAIEYLRNENGQRDPSKPFFMCVAFNPPHSPYESLDNCMEDDYNLYKDKSLTELYVRPNADTTMRKARSIRYYLANVTAVDREFGRILDALKELGLDKNTIVVFTSDHGETMCSHATDDPKNSIWTESFNVPFMIRYPGTLKHCVTPALLSSIDIMPTLLSLCGLRKMIPSTAEGRDLSRTLRKGKGGPDCALYIRNVDGTPDADGLVRNFFPVARGIKTDRYTFEVALKRDGSLASMMLFDDAADPYQMHNIDRSSAPELYASMLARLRAKLVEANDMWIRDGWFDKIINN